MKLNMLILKQADSIEFSP